jgi:hypothetical protein
MAVEGLGQKGTEGRRGLQSESYRNLVFREMMSRKKRLSFGALFSRKTDMIIIIKPNRYSTVKLNISRQRGYFLYSSCRLLR